MKWFVPKFYVQGIFNPTLREIIERATTFCENIDLEIVRLVITLHQRRISNDKFNKI